MYFSLPKMKDLMVLYDSVKTAYPWKIWFSVQDPKVPKSKSKHKLCLCSEAHNFSTTHILEKWFAVAEREWKVNFTLLVSHSAFFTVSEYSTSFRWYENWRSDVRYLTFKIVRVLVNGIMSEIYSVKKTVYCIETGVLSSFRTEILVPLS